VLQTAGHRSGQRAELLIEARQASRRRPWASSARSPAKPVEAWNSAG